MDKIKDFCYNLSLRKSIVLYILVFAVLAIFLSTATAGLCSHAIQAINNSYPLEMERYYLTNESGEQLGEGTYISKQIPPLSERDKKLQTFFNIVPVISAPLYSAFCLIAAALLFYKNKLKKPLSELLTASEKIAHNNLDFRVNYQSRDEFGQLCASFEIMRSMLVKNFSEMWRQVEERKQLNAAFAHDLRTPLTVIKGYNEILQTSENRHTQETAATMEKHISRMEAYVDSMGRLQRLEDAQPNYNRTDLLPFLSTLQESSKILCTKKGKTLYVQNEVSVSRLSIDIEFISQVLNNLIANAVRYADTQIILSFTAQDTGLLLSVTDDGKGFDKDCLSKAVNPYFTEEQNRSEHFGLGLYICKLLCERHNGYLQIENTADGAKVTAFFKSSAP